MLIKIGDVVETDHKIAKIVGIEKVLPNEKYGYDCLEANIGEVGSDRRLEYVVDLDNGHWCYANQIMRMINER